MKPTSRQAYHSHAQAGLKRFCPKASLLEGDGICVSKWRRELKRKASVSLISLWADRRTCLVRRVCSARERTGKIFFCQAFLFLMKGSLIHRQHETSVGRPADLSCPACLRCAGAHRKDFLLPSFSFPNERQLDTSSAWNLCRQTGGLVLSGVSAVRGSAPERFSFAKLFFS